MDAEARDRTIRRVTWATLGTNLLLTCAKLLVGVLGLNQALVADGIHSFSDALSDGLVLVGASLWSAPPDDDHPHGHGRIETFLTLMIGLMLGAVGIGIVVHAFNTFEDPSPAQHGVWVFAAAIVSLVVNEGLYHWSVRAGRRVGAPILIANAWHHRSDGLSSLPVALSVVVRHFQPEWTYVDPVAAVVVGAVILKTAWEISREAVEQLVDGGASEEARDEIERIVLAHPEVQGMHALRTRHIGSGLQVDLHIQLAPELTVRRGHEIAHETTDELMAQGPNVANVLVHVEPADGHSPD